MVKALTGKRTPEIRADVLMAIHGLGIFILALIMTQLSVPMSLSIPVISALSGASWFAWFARRWKATSLAIN